MHRYACSVRWTGAGSSGTSSYDAYRRDHVISVPGKPELLGSSDPAFRGDAGRHNPEELLVASLSACHMLWYLHLCADAGVRVMGYLDEATGVMKDDRFAEVVLRPVVTLAVEADQPRALALHDDAHARCFIARSVNFPVRCSPAFEARAEP